MVQRKEREYGVTTLTHQKWSTCDQGTHGKLVGPGRLGEELEK